MDVLGSWVAGAPGYAKPACRILGAGGKETSEVGFCFGCLLVGGDEKVCIVHVHVHVHVGAAAAVWKIGSDRDAPVLSFLGFCCCGELVSWLECVGLMRDSDNALAAMREDCLRLEVFTACVLGCCQQR